MALLWGIPAKLIDRAAKRSRDTILNKRYDSFDVVEAAQLRAAFDSASYLEEKMLSAVNLPDRLDVLSRAAAAAPGDGLWLEFGVASGGTITHFGNIRRTGKVYGFDSFEGLPEDWTIDHGKGKFAQPLPVVPANVELIKGWFSDTLPGFLASHPGPVTLLHIDCDLYSSTAYVLQELRHRIRPGTVIAFDEYLNYPGWRHHEFKAWSEFVEANGVRYTYDSFVASHQQVVVIVEEISARD